MFHCGIHSSRAITVAPGSASPGNICMQTETNTHNNSSYSLSRKENEQVCTCTCHRFSSASNCGMLKPQSVKHIFFSAFFEIHLLTQ